MSAHPSPASHPRATRKTHRFLGWIFDKPLNIEKIGFMAHRACGVGLLVYLIFHLIVTSAVVGGESFFIDVMGTLSNPAAHIGEIIVVAAVGFHGMNGIRLVLIGLGVISGRPRRPDFPYVAPSLNKAEKGTLWMAFGVAVLGLLFASFFILIGG